MVRMSYLTVVFSFYIFVMYKIWSFSFPKNIEKSFKFTVGKKKKKLQKLLNVIIRKFSMFLKIRPKTKHWKIWEKVVITPRRFSQFWLWTRIFLIIILYFWLLARSRYSNLVIFPIIKKNLLAIEKIKKKTFIFET